MGAVKAANEHAIQQQQSIADAAEAKALKAERKRRSKCPPECEGPEGNPVTTCNHCFRRWLKARNDAKQRSLWAPSA